MSEECFDRAKNAGWVSPKKLPKGPNGRALCRWCNTEVPQGRRTFCGEACVEQHKIRSDPGWARGRVKERDKGICAMCGLNAERLEKLTRRIWWRNQRWRARLIKRWPWIEHKHGYQRSGSFWHADHIKPVVEGGGGCGLENLRTLCIPCHLEVTRELHGRLKRKRSKQPELF